jgi:hypothetical protein
LNYTEQNPAIYVPGNSTEANTQQRRLNPNFSSVGLAASASNSVYNSLRLNVQKRFSKGLTRSCRMQSALSAPRERTSCADPAFSIRISALKDFAITERWRLQFRAKFFNAFNNVNFGQPGHYLGSPGTGQITSANNPRILSGCVNSSIDQEVVGSKRSRLLRLTRFAGARRTNECDPAKECSRTPATLGVFVTPDYAGSGVAHPALRHR